MTIRRSVLILLSGAAACASVGRPHLAMTNRPPAVAGEWIDVRHATPDDTSLWILRGDGYDGTAHLIRRVTETGVVTERHQTKYATWYLRGDVADSTHQICFARRLGRDGLTCWRFSLDTIETANGVRRRMVVKDYQGQHTRGDRILLAREP
jgi:hypothetical protein